MTTNKKRTKTMSQVSKNGAAPKQVVVTHNAAGAKKKKNRNVVSIESGGSDTYKLALINPFSEKALGCRVPDQYFSPTATLSLREVVSLGNDTSGNFDCILMPSAILPAVSFRASISNGTTLITPDGTAYGNGQIYNSATSLSAKITNHRIVSWGVRIRNTSALTASAGTMTVALVPVHERMRVPTNLSIGGNAPSGAGASNFTAQNWLSAMGLPVTGSGPAARLDITNLLDFPYHVRYNGVKLAEETYEIHPKMTSPSAIGFRNSNDSYWGQDIQVQTSAIFIQPGDASYLLCDGWTSIVIGFSGGSATANTNTFEAEVIYHLEGSPNVSTGTNFIVDSPISTHMPMAAFVAQAALNNSQPFVKVAGAAMAAFRAFAGA